MEPVTFRSRIDAWLIVAVAAAVGLLLFQAATAYARAPSASLASLGVLGLLLAIGRLFAVPCDYTLDASQLVIRSGVLRQRIAYADITAVEPSRSLWSAPALSLQRVRIGHAGRSQWVSPRERESFIAELQRRVSAARAPQQHEGSR